MKVRYPFHFISLFLLVEPYIYFETLAVRLIWLEIMELHFVGHFHLQPNKKEMTIL